MTTDLSFLDQFYHPQPIAPPALPWIRSLYAPGDDVQGAILACLSQTRTQLAVSMFALTAPAIVAKLLQLAQNPAIALMINLDQSMSETPEETRVVAQLRAAPGINLAIGKSSKGGISHNKLAVIDRQIVVTGSTNWTPSGCFDEDNHLLIISESDTAAESLIIISMIHAIMKAQAAKAQQQQPEITRFP